jgi:hypothetical protein
VLLHLLLATALLAALLTSLLAAALLSLREHCARAERKSRRDDGSENLRALHDQYSGWVSNWMNAQAEVRLTPEPLDSLKRSVRRPAT